MISYELAKRLKEVGFKQGNIGVESPNSWYSTDGNLQDWCAEDSDTYLPTLSELIEACGRYFCSLNNRCGIGENTWRTWSFPKEGVSHDVSGLTPEEAVAKLWLALHSK